MSVQFGRWNFEGQPAPSDYIAKVSETLAPYGPDSHDDYSKQGVTILYRAFHTTKESRRETQPHISPSGVVITWDGRLDNRRELISDLRGALTAASTDVDIVAEAYENWGDRCFGKLLGDWAVVIWNPNRRSLLLAKDPIGTRQLYYAVEKDHIAWSTVLDPLVRFAGKTFSLNEEYIAGWFSSLYPAAHLTPCVGIYSVPPSSSALLAPGKQTFTRYWDFDPGKTIRYRLDAEYEDHFRAVFAKAVQRKLRSDGPILSELSGGRDSSSIVCMADTIIASGQAECARLETISYYNDSEPNWNERPYFAKVEEKRGRTGWHFNVGPQEQAEKPEPQRATEPTHARFSPYPGYDGRTSFEMRTCLTSLGSRVLLSGIGGDEVMGGVPTSAPELQNLLARLRVGRLAHQLKVWALEKRKPWFHLFWEAARDFFPVSLVGVPKYMRPVSWLQKNFTKRHWAALAGYPSRTKLFGPLPSFQASVATIDILRRQLARVALPFDPPFEKRFPFLDRDLLEFMFAIPREQLVRPAQRRSLMRRALAGMVPDEILNRKSKAFVARAPLVGISQDWARLSAIAQDMIASAIGIVDANRFSEALQKARRGENDELPAIALTTTIFIEGWLRDLRTLGVIDLGASAKPKLALSSYAKT
jgi:asparagine synthase (glutamine-hydrolysing)